MTEQDFKADLHSYLRKARQAVVWKLDGLSDYDVRRPLVPTGTNLLGLLKHLTAVEFGYFGDTFGRPSPDKPAWDESDPNSDMFAAPGESRELIVGLYQKAWAHSDLTIETLPLDAVGHVPWWPAEHSAVTLHRVLVHMTTETDRHAGHADIVRELIDGAAGLSDGMSNLPSDDQSWWRSHYDRVERAAREASGLPS